MYVFCCLLQQGLDGAMAEFGVFRGETARGMLSLARSLGHATPLHLFDTFSGLPDPHPADLGDTPPGEWDHLEHYAASERAVRRHLRMYTEGIDYHLHAGLFADTGASFHEPLFFAHIDADLFEGTRDALAVCDRLMVPLGVVVIDDYGSDWIGVTQAVNEWVDVTRWRWLRPMTPTDPQQAILVRLPDDAEE
jgi:hypothetical protein